MSIALEGPCGVEQAEAIKQAILDGIDAGEDSLDFSGVTDVDMTFFQLIHSVRKAGGESGAGMELSATLPSRFAAQAAWCGLKDIVSQTD